MFLLIALNYLDKDYVFRPSVAVSRYGIVEFLRVVVAVVIIVEGPLAQMAGGGVPAQGRGQPSEGGPSQGGVSQRRRLGEVSQHFELRFCLGEPQPELLLFFYLDRAEQQKPYVPRSCCVRDRFHRYINQYVCQQWRLGPPAQREGAINRALYYTVSTRSYDHSTNKHACTTWGISVICLSCVQHMCCIWLTGGQNFWVGGIWSCPQQQWPTVSMTEWLLFATLHGNVARPKNQQCADAQLLRPWSVWIHSIKNIAGLLWCRGGFRQGEFRHSDWIRNHLCLDNGEWICVIASQVLCDNFVRGESTFARTQSESAITSPALFFRSWVSCYHSWWSEEFRRRTRDSSGHFRGPLRPNTPFSTFRPICFSKNEIAYK